MERETKGLGGHYRDLGVGSRKGTARFSSSSSREGRRRSRMTRPGCREGDRDIVLDHDQHILGNLKYFKGSKEEALMVPNTMISPPTCTFKNGVKFYHAP